MSHELIKTLKENNISSNDYKNFVFAEEEKIKNKPEPKKQTEIFSWHVYDNDYFSNNLIHHFYAGKDYYLLVDPNLKIDPFFKKSCIAAIEKGFVTQNLDEIGIKLFDKKSLIEIKDKVKNDVRLYTDHAYVNEEGKILVIFDATGSHKTILRKAKKLKTKELEISRVPHANIEGEELEISPVPHTNIEDDHDHIETLGDM